MNSQRCKKCGTFMSSSNKHRCKSVDLKGLRRCGRCGKKLKNKGWERHSKLCGSCRRIIQRRNERKLKLKLKKQFGGKCEVCGYSKFIECLEFHHKNKDEKTGKHFLTEVLKHPEKFHLFCNRCHRERHVEAGDYKGGKDNSE